jgi:hypothetical protein
VLIINTFLVGYQGMFVHPEDDYDFVVKLRPAVLPRYFQNVTPDTAVWINSGNDTSQNDEAPVRPGFDPAQMYLGDLTVREELLSCGPSYLYNDSAYLRRHGQVFL